MLWNNLVIFMMLIFFTPLYTLMDKSKKTYLPMAHARNDFMYPILPSMKGLGIYIIVSRLIY